MNAAKWRLRRASADRSRLAGTNPGNFLERRFWPIFGLLTIRELGKNHGVQVRAWNRNTCTPQKIVSYSKSGSTMWLAMIGRPSLKGRVG
jgi:hypothetical protein